MIARHSDGDCHAYRQLHPRHCRGGSHTSGHAAQPGFRRLLRLLFLKPDPGHERELVVFTPRLDPGTILVSFSDRYLYYVLPNSRAIRYPIGAPMGEARWSGVTPITEKRI